VKYGPNDILLVNPTGGWETKRDDHYFYPIGLLYLKNYLRKFDIPSEIIDINPEGLSPVAFKDRVKTLSPKIIGYTGSPYERHSLHEYIRGIKEFAPDALVVVGGAYFTAVAVDCLTNLKEVDVVVRGEGEATFLDVVRTFESGGDMHDVLGINFRDPSENIVATKNRDPCNRDECEIDIDLVPDNEIYSPLVYLKNFEKEGIQSVPILLARGCTMKCTFCFNNNSGRFRTRSIESVVEEINKKRKRFNCDYFWMVDPTFSLRKKFAFALCDALENYCKGIKWYCETRVDCDLELLRKMAQAGCVSIDYALESGSPKVLRAIKKEIDIERVEVFAKESHDLGMRGLVFVMYSLPEETYEDFQKTASVLKRVKPYTYDISFTSTQILPGTQLEHDARASGMLSKEFSWFDPNFKDVPIWQGLMDADQLSQCLLWLQRYKYKLNHSRFAYLRKATKENLVIMFNKNQRISNFVKRNKYIYNYTKSTVDFFFGKDS